MQLFLKRINGFSLIEILVVLEVLVLLSTLSIPLIRNFQPNLQLSAAIRDMSTDIRYAQQLSITEQVIYGVRFNSSAKTYDIIRIDTATTTVKTVSLPSNVVYGSIGFGDKVVRFNSYGAVQVSGTVVLENTNNQSKSIIVKPSGYVQIQ